MKPLRIAFVDPVSSSGYLGQTLRKNQIESIALLTPKMAQLYSLYTSHLKPYEYDYLLRINDSESSLEFVKKLDPTLIFYGFEFSIPHADQIVQKLLPDQVNDLQLTAARYHKFEMHQRVKNLNLPYAIPQIRVTCEDLPKLKEKIVNFVFPLYVKPAISLGTTGGKLCTHYEELLETLTSYLKEKEKDYTYLIQEYITGTEYFIDTVSINGVHHIVGLCKYMKKQIHKRSIPYTLMTVDPKECVHWSNIEKFIRETLSAVGYRNGFAHTEFFIREDGSIKLVEVNCRISGGVGYPNKMFSLVYGKNVIEVLLYALKNQTPSPLISTGYAKKINLQNWSSENRPLNQKNTKELFKLRSYKEHMFYRPDQVVVAPVESFTEIYDSPGTVLLYNTDLDQLDQDIETIDILFDRKEVF